MTAVCASLHEKTTAIGKAGTGNLKDHVKKHTWGAMLVPQSSAKTCKFPTVIYTSSEETSLRQRLLC